MGLQPNGEVWPEKGETPQDHPLLGKYVDGLSSIKQNGDLFIMNEDESELLGSGKVFEMFLGEENSEQAISADNFDEIAQMQFRYLNYTDAFNRLTREPERYFEFVDESDIKLYKRQYRLHNLSGDEIAEEVLQDRKYYAQQILGMELDTNDPGFETAVQDEVNQCIRENGPVSPIGLSFVINASELDFKVKDLTSIGLFRDIAWSLRSSDAFLGQAMILNARRAGTLDRAIKVLNKIGNVGNIHVANNVEAGRKDLRDSIDIK